MPDPSYSLSAGERARRLLALRTLGKCLRCGGQMVAVKSERGTARDCKDCGAKERGQSFSWSEYWALPDSGSVASAVDAMYA
jgi:hypothetical protein